MIDRRAVILCAFLALILAHALPLKDVLEVLISADNKVIEVEAEPQTELQIEPQAEIEIVTVDEVSESHEEIETYEIYDLYESLGDFYITAYCPCEICCGYWATIRGDKITGASGEELIAGYSMAADTSVIPFGMYLYINGQEYKVSDTGGTIIGNRLDLYFDTHEEALQFAQGYYEIQVKIDCD